MLKTLAACNSPEEVSTIKGKNFHEVAQYFMDPALVPTEQRKSLIRSRFTEVELSASRKAFLSSDWPYVYTLNIDDAIERNSRYTFPVLPYKNIALDKLGIDCVYKIHGCAKHEIVYDEPHSIIFSTDSYVQSFAKNKSMLSLLRNDLVEQNTVFIGCALDEELDLLHSLINFSGNYPARQSIYVTTSGPTKFGVARLERYGINHIICVDDFDEFYNFFETRKRPTLKKADNLKPYRVKAVEFPLKRDRNQNIAFLVKDPGTAPTPEKHVLPDYFIDRDLTAKLLTEMGHLNPCLIRGRRYSGKTTLLRGLANRSRDKDVYFFNSQNSVSEEAAQEMGKARNALFLLDTNTLSPGSTLAIIDQMQQLRNNNSTLVFAVNKTEPEIYGVLAKHIDDQCDFELPSHFSPDELRAVNTLLNQLGMFRFEQSKTILNNTFAMLEKYNRTRTSSALYATYTLTRQEEDVLLAIGVLDKCYTSVASALGIRGDGAYSLAQKMGAILDIVDTSPAEMKEAHSRSKIIHNSQIGIRLALSSIVERAPGDSVSIRIFEVAERLLSIPQFEKIGKRLVMFDAVNDLLTDPRLQTTGSGYRSVILKLYAELQNIMFDSSDYWLQRAKAILNVESDPEEIKQGIDFARKAYDDADRTRTMDNAEFTIALLYGKLCAVQNYSNPEHVLRAVEWFDRAVDNYARNRNYIRTLIIGTANRKSYFELLCDHLSGPVESASYLTKRSEIRHLLDVRHSVRSGR